MQERKQKILLEDNSFPQTTSTECDGYEGVQTYIGITENNFVEVQLTRASLLEEVLSPSNLNRAYKQVMRNKGAAGVASEGCQNEPFFLVCMNKIQNSIGLMMPKSYFDI